MSAVDLVIGALDKLNPIRRVKRMQDAVLAIIYQNNLDMPIQFGSSRCAFITITYRPDAVWAAYHITQLQKCYEMWAKRRSIKISIVWVMELTKNGVPHYHLLIWLPKGITPPMPDKQGWWKHGNTNATWLKKPSRYIAKYFSKSPSKDGKHAFPKGARIFGHRGLSAMAMAVKRHYSLPYWLRKITEIGANCVKCFGGWWYNADIDYSFRSPWVLGNDADGIWVFKNVGFTPDDALPFDVRKLLSERKVTKSVNADSKGRTSRKGKKTQSSIVEVFSPELAAIMARVRG